MRWIPYVMVRVAGFFVAGILLGIYVPALFPVAGVTVFLTILFFAYLFIRVWLQRTLVLRLVSGVLGLLTIFLSGFLSVTLRDHSRRFDSLSQNNEIIVAYRMKLASAVERRDNSWRCLGQVQWVMTATGWKECTGKVMAYWPLAERADTLEYGDVLLVEGSPREIEGPQNPYAFDYRRFLALRNIFHQHFLRAGRWVVEQSSKEQGPAYYATKARTWTTTVMGRFVQGKREVAIVNAFVIGVTDGIDDELKQAYAAGGAMHALAVSGLHVSILYGVLLFLLRPVEKRRGGPWSIAVISLVALWMYGFITGLSPSVLRAVAMFSFVAIAKPMGRTTSIINTLAASAFFLLLYDPYLILSAGFQLSYLAVLGIVLLYRPIYNLWELPWSWADWVWQITCVSIAAQIATLPVTLYYFHQFPVYFLLANLFVIPFSAIILLGGVLLLVISPFDLLASWMGKLLSLLVYLLNEGLFLVEQLPSSLVTELSISLLQAFCAAGFVIATYLLFQTKKFHWSLAQLSVALIFSLDGCLVNRSQQPQFVIYRVPQHTGMEWFHQREAFSVMDSVLGSDQEALQYHIRPNQLANHIDRVRTATAWSGRGVESYVCYGKRFLWVYSKGLLPATLAKTDYLIISRNAVNSLESLSRNINFDVLILDSSNSLRYCVRLKAEAAQLRKRCFSVLTDGAFTLTL